MARKVIKMFKYFKPPKVVPLEIRCSACMSALSIKPNLSADDIKVVHQYHTMNCRATA